MKRSRRRTLCIEVKSDAKVFVCAPTSLKDADVFSFVKKKSLWIIEKIKEVERRSLSRIVSQYQDGEEFLFLGKKHAIHIVEKNIKQSSIEFDGFMWRIFVPEKISAEEKKKTVKEKLIQWYRRQAEELLAGRIFHYARILKVEPQEIAVKTQKRLWGICDYRKKIIRLNWLLILAPLSVVDYVVVHELCHLLAPNHSRTFWKKVENFYPQYKECKKWLKKHASLMVLP